MVENSLETPNNQSADRRTRHPGTRYKVLLPLAIVFCLVCSGLLIWQSFQFKDSRTQIEKNEHRQAQQEAKRAAGSINEKLQTVVQSNKQLAASLTNSPNLSKGAVMQRLKEVMSDNPILFGAGVAYLPEAFDGKPKLYAPYYAKINNVPQAIQIEKNYDYTIRNKNNNWFYLPLDSGEPVWQEPHYGRASQTTLANYTAPLKGRHAKTGNEDTIGVVFTSLSPKEYQSFLVELDLGSTGYGFILSQEGRFVAHPNESWVRQEETTFFDRFKELDDVCETLKSAMGRQTECFHDDRLTGRPAWICAAPIEEADWTMVVVYNSGENLADQTKLHQRLTRIILLAVLFAISLSLLDSAVAGWRTRFAPWRLSVLISLVLLGGTTVLMLPGFHRPAVHTTQLNPIADQGGLKAYLSNYKKENIEPHQEKTSRNKPVYIPTGVFLQSIDFLTANDVEVKGYIWQKYRTDEQSKLIPPAGEVGFILPEAISLETKEAFRRGEDKEDKVKVIGWEFKTVMRQSFNYKRYPFDEKNVWIRLWHHDFHRNVILVPDLLAYQITQPSTLPGIQEEFVLRGWNLDRSFFAYQKHSYNTNFGIKNYVGQVKFPELYFNVVLTRSFASALITNFIPLAVVTCMLFGMLLSITTAEDKNRLLDFNFSSLLAVVSGLFFVVLISHVQLRREISARELLYMEYFYFSTYMLILMISVIAYAVATNARAPLFHYKDSLLPKLLYWPVALIVAFTVTLVVFHWPI